MTSALPQKSFATLPEPSREPASTRSSIIDCDGSGWAKHNVTRASVSLDLDNLWSYLKTHGDSGWQSWPSYLERVVPRALQFLADRSLSITFFIVGRDAAQPQHRAVLHEIARAGHEIGNHSFEHEPWLHTYSSPQLHDELARAEDALELATGFRPVGFRGPGFSWSKALLETLVERGYEYDASTFPTFLGPLARAYYFFTARLTRDEKRQRAKLFGGLREGFRPNRPYRWELDAGSLVEIPVTTFPLLRTPIHVSYLNYLSGYSRLAARGYFQAALAACRVAGSPPSLLLHPLDFLGPDDCPQLSFFPGMHLSAAYKLRLLDEVLQRLSRDYALGPMLAQSRELSGRSHRLPVHRVKRD